MGAFAYSGYLRTDSGIRKSIGIQGRKFLYEGNYEKGTPVYREKSTVVEVQEGNIYDRSNDSQSSIPSETLHEDLYNLSQAHLLDPCTIPEYLWRQETLYDPSNDELVMSPFPNLPEDTYLVNEIPPVNSNENVCEILAVKVEESHLDLEEREELLNTVSLFSDVSIEGIKDLTQTPLLQYKIELNDTSPLKSKHYNLGRILEEIARSQIQEYIDAGFNVRGESEYVSPAFVVIKPTKADDPQVDNHKRYFKRNFILPRHETMEELIHASLLF
jgi:hypothetical protein